MAVYEASCAGCHGADGTGVAGRGRPLTGIAAQGDRATHVASITDGKGGMPAFGERLSADEIDQAASYVRLTFVEEAAAAQEEELARTGVDSTGLAVIGTALLAGGVQLVIWSRRNEDTHI
jgi:mono/diheme cytochrome c family protein